MGGWNQDGQTQKPDVAECAESVQIESNGAESYIKRVAG